jgi:hypothetical protein
LGTEAHRAIRNESLWFAERISSFVLRSPSEFLNERHPIAEPFTPLVKPEGCALPDDAPEMLECPLSRPS